MNDDILNALTEMIFSITGKTAAPSCNLVIDAGCDLFDISELIVAVEDRFGFDIPDEDSSFFSTPEAAAEYISERLSDIRKWMTAGNE